MRFSYNFIQRQFFHGMNTKLPVKYSSNHSVISRFILLNQLTSKRRFSTCKVSTTGSLRAIWKWDFDWNVMFSFVSFWLYTVFRKPDRQWRSSSFQESKKVRVSRDLWPWPWPWAHPGCTLTWSPSCESLVAIRPFVCEKKRFAQKFTDGQTDRQTDRRRTPRHCISSFLEWAKKTPTHVFFYVSLYTKFSRYVCEELGIPPKSKLNIHSYCWLANILSNVYLLPWNPLFTNI